MKEINIWEHDKRVREIYDKHNAIPLGNGYFKYSENGIKRVIACAMLFGMKDVLNKLNKRLRNGK